MMVDARDKEYLQRIKEYCQRIDLAKMRFGDSLEMFSSDADYRDVICMNIFQIGELSNQLSESIKAELVDIPWDEMYGIRNILAHAYIKIDDQVIWDTVVNDIPALETKLQEVL